MQQMRAAMPLKALKPRTRKAPMGVLRTNQSAAGKVLLCGSEKCEELMQTTWPAMRRAGMAWALAQPMECELCQRERARRKRVLEDAVAEGFIPPTPVYASAPYIHPYNWPKYQAAQKRALIFARERRCQVLWVRAVDMPITGDDKGMVGETLERYRQRWLQLHDMKTGGIMGLCPLA